MSNELAFDYCNSALFFYKPCKWWVWFFSCIYCFTKKISIIFFLGILKVFWTFFKNIFLGLPFLVSHSSNQDRREKSQIAWIQPVDDWNITTAPRSIYPHLENKNHKHVVPLPHTGTHLYTIDSDEKLLARLLEIRVWLQIN